MPEANLSEQMVQILSKVDEVKKVQEDKLSVLTAQVKELETKNAVFNEQLLSVQQSAHKPEQAEAVSMSLSDQFMKSEQFTLNKNSGAPFTVTLDTDVVKTPKGYPDDFPEKEFRALPTVPTVVTGLFASIPTSATSITVISEKKFTNSVAKVAEGAAFPKSGIETEKKSFNVIKLGHIAVVTDEVMEDTPELKQLLDVRMPQGIADKIEDEILNGTGATDHLEGLLKTGNYLAHGFKKTNFNDNDTVIDLVKKCVATMKMTGRKPQYIILNPMDYCDTLSLKDKEGRLLTSGNPWGGLTVVEAAAMPKGKFLVVDPSGAVLRKKRELEVGFYPQNGTDAEKDQATIKASVRLAFVIRDPNCFIGGDYTKPTA